jgi:hypothetical protein
VSAGEFWKLFIGALVWGSLLLMASGHLEAVMRILGGVGLVIGGGIAAACVLGWLFSLGGK